MSDPYYANVSLLLPMEGADTSTAFVDYSPTPNAITLSGNPKISTTQSKRGNGSGYFDGTGGFLLVAHNSSLYFDGDFTIEFAVYLAATPSNDAYPRILAKQEDSSGGFILFVDSNRAAVFKINNAINIAIGVLSLAAWNHVAICRQGTSVKTFLEGVSNNSGTVSGVVGGTNPWYIGRSANIGNYFNGYLQDLRLTKGVARYTANFTPPSRLLIQNTLALSGAAWQTVSGTVTVSGNGGAQQVVIREVETRILVATATPNATTGAWTASVPPGDYDITYFAPDCQPICHGPYTVV